ncbi:MAG TPA: hypothetical protein VEX36_11945 [Thermoleophilaceae bacterium]|nr:hypothetical protein [Thermoleophilaceae bacterium]
MVALVAASAMVSSVAVAVAPPIPPFDIVDFSARSLDAQGDDYAVAGGHPHDVEVSFGFPNNGEPAGVELVKSTYVDSPPGFVGNPAAAARCTMVQMKAGTPTAPACPPRSLVGHLVLTFTDAQQTLPLFNMVPERGYPAQFGFRADFKPVVLYPRLRPRTGRYGITVASPGIASLEFFGIKAVLYGVPSQRDLPGGGPSAGGAPVPFLSNPGDCLVAEPVTRLFADSWPLPARTLPSGAADFGFPDLSDPLWKSASAVAPAATGCDSPALASQFRPSLDMRPTPSTGTTQADAPSGYTVDLKFPQAANDPTDSSSPADPSVPLAPPLKDATVTLPEGVSVSPSAADGLEGCIDTGPGDQVHYDTTDPAACPDGSKVGSVVATSPLLAERAPQTDEVIGADPIGGNVFVIAPHPGDLDPSGGRDGLFRLLVEIDSREHGINVKIPGVVTADKDTGRLTARFEDNPQLPAKSLRLVFDPGPRAPLANPATCTTATTTGVFTPWSRGGGRGMMACRLRVPRTRPPARRST